MSSSADASIWSACLATLSKELSPQQFSTWIQLLSCEESGEELCILAPNTFVQDWVRRNFGERIETLAQTIAGQPLRIRYTINKAAPASVAPNGTVVHNNSHSRNGATPVVAAVPATAAPTTLVTSAVASSIAPAGNGTRHETHRLNSSFTFDTFVTGKANQLARAASLQVAESPTSYNPLFIYGGVGLGKTHLIQAIGNHLLQHTPSARIRYIHAEKYVSDVVHAYQHKSFDEFKRYYHSLDLLLIDDIQFFRDKGRTQEEFFYLFNALVEAHKQVVITCDTYPREIKGLEERLVSRFGWGLIVALEPPELEMRVAILLAKAKSVNVALDEQVAFFIAKHIRSNVRELEGALKRVLAYASFHAADITLTVAKEALRDLIAVQNRQVSIENIQKTVADYYKIRIADMQSKKRSRAIARPRQVAMALSKELTELSLPEIGNRFGGRDHTTVLHACRQISQLRETNPEISHDVNFLLQVLRS
ncbi:MAG: chromosomal replication initiator protein DnaA [Proteobacteria bacterium]|nr:chromosomal replication initiator protein DnaA [Pseudomonadota bacterium]MCL2308236.1 chromosomal replication initiator protein DnaA [Pseudomonadota bacterium]